MLVFLVLCAVSLWAGIGILILLGLKLDRTQVWLLAPGICLICWAIALGTGVSLGVTVGRLAPPIWAVTAATAIFGAWRAGAGFPQEVLRPLVVVATLPMAMLPFDIWQGLHDFIGGPAGDGWSYVAFGQYLWEIPKGAEGQFAPLHQYASHLHRTRFIASALLGLISPLTGEAGDTQAAAGYFVAWVLFVFGASCAFVGLATGLRRGWLLAFCALAVMSRWVFGAIEIHNYDNLIAISFLPMVIGIFSGLERPDGHGAVALGGLLAAAVYIYPEMVVFILLGGALGFTRRMRIGSVRHAWIGMVAGAGILAALTLLPAFSDLRWFIASQVSNATAAVGTRAGEGGFSELLRLRDWGATVWGLTSATADLRAGAGWQFVRTSMGVLMWALTGAGMVRAIRERQWDVAGVAIILMAGALVMVVQQQYSYGAYKFILLGWWSVTWLAVAGAQGLAMRTTASIGLVSVKTLRLGVASVVALILMALPGSVAARVVMFHRIQPATSMEPYRGVLGAERVIGNEPIIVAVNDVLANEWAVYFLRRHSLLLFGYRGYMAFPHVVPLMDQAAPVDIRRIRHVLSDGTAPLGRDIVWKQGPYHLWRIPSSGAAFLRNVTNPNGAESANGRPFYWIGNGDTELDVFATSAGDATVSGRFLRGPSLPDQAERHILIRGSDGTERAVTIASDGEHSFSVHLHAGESRVTVRPLDKPSVTVTGPGDTRPLLLGVEGLSVSMEHR